MKVNGSILLVRDGSFSNITHHNIQKAIFDFASMVKEADNSKDTLYYDSDEWGQFHARGYSPTDPLWRDVGDIEYSMLFNISHPLFRPVQIGNTEEFETKPVPRIHGGFCYDGCDIDNYVFDKQSINKWHNQWFLDNPDVINWKKYNNAIWPRYDRTIEILRQELSNANKAIPSDDKDIANLFHHEVMKPLDVRERISKSRIIGATICEANYYHREEELERLEVDCGNIHAERIYAIKKDGKYQFLSIDIQHGMFELCDDKGDHLGEFRFDGTPNGNNTIEVDHGLRCINEWKRNYRK